MGHYPEITPLALLLLLIDASIRLTVYRHFNNDKNTNTLFLPQGLPAGFRRLGHIPGLRAPFSRPAPGRCDPG